MESTSAYWKPPFCLLEDAIECWVVNARDVKASAHPRPTGWIRSGCPSWPSEGCSRPSSIPPPCQRQLRDLSRYRRTLVHDQTREKQRAEKLLEDTQIKLSSVISDIFGISGRDMLAALIAGQHAPAALADLARGVDALQERHPGRRRSPGTSAATTPGCSVDARPDRCPVLPDRRTDQPHRPGDRPLSPVRWPSSTTSPASAPSRAPDLIAEIGVEMTRFPTAGHLVSWAKFAPLARQSAQEQTWPHRKGQPLARRHPRRGRRRCRSHQHLSRFTLPPDRPPPWQTPRHRRARQLHPGDRLAPALRTRRPVHRPGPRLARPARADPPQASAHR